MKSKFLVGLLLISICLKSYSQSLDRVKSYASTGTVIGYDIATSSNGNVLIAGEFNGTVDFDPGIGVSSVNGGFSTGWSTYLSCFDSTGNFLWVKTWNFNLTFTDKAYIDLVLKNNDEIVLAGYFNSIADFNPDAANFQLNANNGKCFLLSLSSSGNFIDAKNLGSGGDVRAQDLTIGENNSILLTGYFLDFTTDFDPSASSSNLGCAGLVDAFILKLDSAFNFSWVKSIGSTNSEYPTRIGTDKFNNVIVAGYFTSPSVNLDPNGSVTGNVSNSGSRDGFICKLDFAGNYLWSGKIGGTDDDRITGLSIDTIGDIWIGGYFEGTCDLDPGTGIQNYTAINSTNSDIFFSKISAAGTSQFVKQIGNDGTDELRAIRIDHKNRFWLLGVSTDTIDFDPGSGIFDYGRILGSFLNTYDSNGDLLFVRDAYTSAFNFTFDAHNNVYTNIITSGFSNFNFYTTAGITTTNYTATTGNYNCLLKYSECTSQSLASLTLNPATLTACDGDTVLITATPTNGGNFASYIWKEYGTAVANQTGATFLTPVYSPPNTVITCQLVSSEGCVDRYPTLPQLVINNVSSGATPTNVISQGASIFCIDDTIILISQITNGGNSPSFQWYKNSILIPGATDSVFSATNFAQFDQFTCLFISSNTCAFQDSVLSLFTMLSGSSLDLSTTVNSHVITATAISGANFQWYNCAVGFTAIPGATGATFTATVNGSYAVVVNDGFCADTSICHVINTVGELELNASENNIKINPNPFENSLELKSATLLAESKIQVTDISGRVVYQGVLGSNSLSINTNEWPKGLYFLRLNEQSIKLVKQ
jgi:hypothetical protein